MVTVVCNATPLINFAAIDRLDVLQQLFSQVLIPDAVYIETTIASFPRSQVLVQAISSDWLQVVPVVSIPVSIPVELDAGERAAIALALEINCQRILLDEREARQVAQALGLQIIGTLGILLLAKNNRILTEIKPLLDAMVNQAQYWVSRTLYEQVLQQANELSE